MPEFTELFKVEYDGKVSDLSNEINQLTGVENASTSTPGDLHRNVTLGFEITYDNHETDRTRLAQEIEEIDGVDEVTFG